MSSTMTVSANQQVLQRRVIEALRSGVPSRQAVAILGSAQPEIEDRFVDQLDSIRNVGENGAGPSGGLLIGGGFGSGKSHVLEHLAHVALNAGFAVSKVVISKETPLHDPVKVFRAAIDSAVLPNSQGEALTEIADSLGTEDPAYTELFRWVHSPNCGLNDRFAATLVLFQRMRANDEEFAELIVRFWGGDPIRVADLRRRLREIGEAGTYLLRGVNVRELALQRFRFAARLMRAAGHAGWVILFDEVELMGRYSVLQRARSYVELARWMRGARDEPGLPLTAVLAITEDFESAVMSHKNDYKTVPAKLKARASLDADQLAARAEEGMRSIEQDIVLLSLPDEAELNRTYGRLRDIHGEAFGWDPPDVPGLERLANTRMRQHVRAWINEWDLVRLDPDFTPTTEVAEMTIEYSEDADLDVTSVVSDGDEDGTGFNP